ncbi:MULTISPECIES: IS3 family transposase, partial [unclassified Exiguobacterium]|uniref:IS3 family transposase n=1 Tax=unclassified Exiguobacterium TaxID=2644629 RepID=UPI001BE504D5
FVRKRSFSSLTVLDRELRDYIHWFNHIRIQGTLGYLTPKEYKQRHLLKTV